MYVTSLIPGPLRMGLIWHDVIEPENLLRVIRPGIPRRLRNVAGFLVEKCPLVNDCHHRAKLCPGVWNAPMPHPQIADNQRSDRQDRALAWKEPRALFELCSISFTVIHNPVRPGPDFRRAIFKCKWNQWDVYDRVNDWCWCVVDSEEGWRIPVNRLVA